MVQNRQSNFPCFLTGRGRRAELADDAEVVPPAAGTADIETMSLQQKGSLCVVSSGYPRLISFATLTAGLRSICALPCLVSPQVRLIRRAIQISRFLTAVVGGFLGDGVELHRLAVERFPLTAGAAPRFGGNIRSEGELTF